MKKFSDYKKKVNENNLEDALSSIVNLNEDELDIIKRLISEIKNLKIELSEHKKNYNKLKDLVYLLRDEMELEEPED